MDHPSLITTSRPFYQLFTESMFYALIMLYLLSTCLSAAVISVVMKYLSLHRVSIMLFLPMHCRRLFPPFLLVRLFDVAVYVY